MARWAVAQQIRLIRKSVREGDCRTARQRFDTQLTPLIRKAPIKPKTMARLWGLVNACRYRERR